MLMFGATLSQMMQPQIQNDFATYRRYLSRLKKKAEAGLLSELPVADTDANAISMFIAEVCAVFFILRPWAMPCPAPLDVDVLPCDLGKAFLVISLFLCVGYWMLHVGCVPGWC